MKFLPFLLLLVLTGCGTVKKISHRAKKLWPFGSAEESADANAKAEKKVADQSTKKPTFPDAPPRPKFTYDKTKQFVTDDLLGASRKTETDGTLTLKEGWAISGTTINYTEEAIGTPPLMLRAEGSPAKATITTNGTTQTLHASQIHYRQDTGLLTLKGSPSANVGGYLAKASSPATIMIFHLSEGTFVAEGPLRYGSKD